MSKALFKSTSTVSMMTMISRILGFIRDIIAAQIYGAGASVDAFYIAFKIPNFMRNLFAEGSFSQAFVPTLTQYHETKSAEEVKSFIQHISGCLTSILLPITIIGVLAAPLIIHVVAPGLDPLRFHLSSEMLRITFPYLLFISLTALCGSILNVYGSFAIPAFTPSLLNICFIIAALYFSSYFAVPVEAQAWAIFVAGAIQLSFQIPFLAKKGNLPTPIPNWKDPGVRRVLKLMIPAIFGASVGQISLLLNTIFASFLKIGSVTWLYYSDRLAYFPLGVFGVALATVVLPHLTRKFTEKNPMQFMSALDWGIRCNCVIGIPASCMLLFFPGPMIATLFGHGKFNTYDVLMTRESVIAYSIGLTAFMLVKVLSTGFYAQQNIKTPVKIAVTTVVINMIFNAIFIIPFAHAGLALATSLSAWLNVILLLYYLSKKDIFHFQKGWLAFSLRLLFANSIMSLLLFWGSGNILVWLTWDWYIRVTHLIFWLISAMVCYFICLWMSGMRLKDFRVSAE